MMEDHRPSRPWCIHPFLAQSCQSAAARLTRLKRRSRELVVGELNQWAVSVVISIAGIRPIRRWRTNLRFERLAVKRALGEI
ncbi:hypothetical protein BU24DRAFT_416374 [Aaosphaeria arxii CBS 175.79]|uniref:Uncharacterized protein n=1 Tax=Aaosphaeria arxii CBS 175.79 TaxID=1450172 RepID=A0A6A5Y550_9PLEO|nr:uncharacterized protein BU24DRAFT_416374 [Aaosphaeria arxii CBS 175.79]KAF2020685.1 hypothetical protein BU24DRAFT_416374 [Aaosphaeria arxii CBS 175.79]